jgi:hypothetical protein
LQGVGETTCAQCEQAVNNLGQRRFDSITRIRIIPAMPNQASPEIAAPSPHNWRTTDEDEINRHRARARTEEFRISNTDAHHPIFSNFRVRSGSGLTYSVEVRDVRQRQFACDCVDFRINGLGTCKHVEAVLLQLQARLDFLNPSLLGSLFRFNREYYDLDTAVHLLRAGVDLSTIS